MTSSIATREGELSFLSRVLKSRFSSSVVAMPLLPRHERRRTLGADIRILTEMQPLAIFVQLSSL